MIGERSKLVIRAGAQFAFATPVPVAAIFIIRPRTAVGVRVEDERWSFMPHADYRDYVDQYGNTCRRTIVPAGESNLTYETTVEIDGAIDPIEPNAAEIAPTELPDDVLLYTLPSRYCVSDLLGDAAYELFGHLPPGWSRVQAIADYVHDHIKFAYGTSSPTTTALDVYESATGVCRDFAHLMITFCRALNIPARYSFGYMPDLDVPPPYAPMDFCAWTEIYIGHRWWLFDPRNNERRRGRVTIARGRDALDVAMVTTFGGVTLRSMTVLADAIDGDASTAT